MTSRVGRDGQVVIPKTIRDALGLVPGDLVDLVLDDDVVRVTPVSDRPRLRGSLADLALVELLEADHRDQRCR